MSSLLKLTLTVITLLNLKSITYVNAKQPEKIYGVNLGSWLVFEPWMAEQAWKNMGGENCSDCASCIRSEWSLNKAYPKKADALFKDHWETWFTQKDVDLLVEYGINTVRIPLGFWIIEALVDRKTEFYAKGGLLQLKRGLRMLHNAGIAVVLDHHALPGVSASHQMFAGNCTRDSVNFYTPPNYARALTWTAVMTTLIHLEPGFKPVFSLQAVNEPIMDASKTPGLQEFYGNFAKVVRAVELVLGITSGDFGSVQYPGSGSGSTDPVDLFPGSNSKLKISINSFSQTQGLDTEVQTALESAIPILIQLSREIGLDFPVVFEPVNREPLQLNYMDWLWQWGNGRTNAAQVTLGSSAYDDHCYYAFGGHAAADPEAYMYSMCNLDRVGDDKKAGQSPMWVGEWSLATQFHNATDEFSKKWADAQKLMYGRGAGWFFWNFKIEISELEGGTSKQWSYFDGVKRGYLTKDPSKFNNPKVYEPYVGKTWTGTVTATSTSSSKSGSASSGSSSAKTSNSASLTPIPTPSLSLSFSHGKNATASITHRLSTVTSKVTVTPSPSSNSHKKASPSAKPTPKASQSKSAQGHGATAVRYTNSGRN